MAGSPTYLNELNRLQVVGEDSGAFPWSGLAIIWETLMEAPREEHTLRYLARLAFTIVSRETDEPWEVTISNARELHVAKNAGYAGADNPDPWANFRLSKAFGITPFDGVLVRLTDKWSRIQSLRRDPTNERIGESLIDTLRDLAAYALIALCLLVEEKEYNA